jgi:hypothetical protein
MITYKLNKEGPFALKLVDGKDTGEWVNTETNQTYLKWLAEGNLPEPADEGTA